MNAVSVAGLPPAITKPADLVANVRAEALAAYGNDGAAARAWEWALAGTCAAPVTDRPAPGAPPSPDEIAAEARTADAEVIPPGVRIYDADPQIASARRVLEWLSGVSDEIPLPAGDRGHYVGGRGDYVRTDEQMREVLAWARFGLSLRDLPDLMDPSTAMQPWRWDSTRMDAAWLRGVRDVLAWVLGDHVTAPLSRETIKLPSLDDVAREFCAAYDVLEQGRPTGQPVQPDSYPPPQYGEAVQATYNWLSGAQTSPPADRHGHGAYAGCRQRDMACACTPASSCTGPECPACANSLCALSQGAI